MVFGGELRCVIEGFSEEDDVDTRDTSGDVDIVL